MLRRPGLIEQPVRGLPESNKLEPEKVEEKKEDGPKDELYRGSNLKIKSILDRAPKSPRKILPSKNSNLISMNPPKAVPPLRNLSSYVVNAIVLSYYGTPFEVGKLLNSLSGTSRAYAERHLPFLKSFLNWDAEIAYSLEFGDTTVKYEIFDSIHPSEKTLKEITRTTVVKLQKIRYKVTELGYLGGIQLEFANLHGSPFFSTDHVFRNSFKTVNIDTTKTIKTVSLKTYREGLLGTNSAQFTAMKFTDKEGVDILDLNFSKGEPLGTWVTYQIPLGH